MTGTGKTTRAQRMAMPLARDVVKDIAISHGGCIRPVQLRRTDLATGETEQVLVPCGHTLASSARRAPNGPGTCAPRNAGKAGTSTMNPTSSPTPPPMTRSGGSSTAPTSRPAATRPQHPGRTPRTWTSCSANWTRKSTAPGCAAKSPRTRPAAAPVHPAAARRPAAAAPQDRSADGRQDLHDGGRQDVPPVAVPHPHLSLVRARHRRRHPG